MPENPPLSPITRRAFLRKCGLTIAGTGAGLIAAANAGCPTDGGGDCYCDYTGQDYDACCGDYCDYTNYADF